MALLPWLTFYSLVNLTNVNNGSHGAVVRYFTTTNALGVIKSVACQQSNSTMQANQQQKAYNIFF